MRKVTEKHAKNFMFMLYENDVTRAWISAILGRDFCSNSTGDNLNFINYLRGLADALEASENAVFTAKDEKK